MNAICAVCGQRPEEDVVHCVQCEGVVHRECWMFFGSCSRFACGGVRFEDGFPPQPAPGSIVIDGSAPEPPRPAARSGGEDYVQLGATLRETEYGQALTLLNRERIPFRTHVPVRLETGAFAAWLYVPCSTYERARAAIEDAQVELDFTPLARRQDLVNYPWALAACVALWVVMPHHKAALAVLGVVAVCGRDVKDRAIRRWRRLFEKRRPVLPAGKDAPPD